MGQAIGLFPILRSKGGGVRCTLCHGGQSFEDLVLCCCQKRNELSLRWKLWLWENEGAERRAVGATTGPSTSRGFHHAAVCWGWSVSWRSFDRLDGGFVQGLWGYGVVHSQWLWEMPAKGLTVQSDCKGHLQLKKCCLWSRLTGDLDLPKRWGVGRRKVEVLHCEALPTVIDLISLELATERVWMSSSWACCRSCLCLAARTLRSQFLLHSCSGLLPHSLKMVEDQN